MPTTNSWDTIQTKAADLAQGEPRARRRRITLYASGIGAKLRQANYALKRIREIDQNADTDIATGVVPLPLPDDVYFYVDSFFAFAYSVFDVFAQVVNQKCNLGIDERGVTYKSVANNNAIAGTPLELAMQMTLCSHKWRNLEKYRHCSTHRRQIYIEARTNVIQGTPGYRTAGPVSTTVRVLCDDPYALNPSTAQNRDLVKYCEGMFGWVVQQINHQLPTI